MYVVHRMTSGMYLQKASLDARISIDCDLIWFIPYPNWYL